MPGCQAPTPFVFNGLPGSTRQQQLRCAQQFAGEQFGPFLSQAPRGKHSMRKSGRLRVGYLSADFHDHATAYLLAGVLAQHDRQKLEVFGYSYGPDTQDVMRQRIRTACDVFRDIHTLAHEQAAQLIAQDQLDILIDLKGFTENARPQITALRPAPVIVNWLGYPGTLGQRRLADYLIGDPVVTPLSHQADYSETLAQLPDCYQPTDADRTAAPTPAKRDAGLPEQGLVFCSFNQTYKITPMVLDAWCKILTATPDSVLWLLEGPQAAMENLRKEALRRGIAPERLIFAPKLPQAAHLGRLALADIALDTFPYTSHTTGSDALWAGVPLLTTLGGTFGSRVAASLLSAAGLPELVCDSWPSYIEQTIALALDGERRQRLRQHLLNGRQTLPLFATQRFTRNLEALFETIRQQHVTGFVRSFAVDASMIQTATDDPLPDI
jgi:predicted O-linked N-acetylglucosamine transferase (SPINDLY family)